MKLRLVFSLLAVTTIAAGCQNSGTTSNPVAPRTDALPAVTAQSNAGGAYILDGFGCGMPGSSYLSDGETIVSFSEGNHTVCTPSKNGNVTLKCYAIDETPPAKAVKLNYANTGITCGSECGETTKWQAVIDTLGNAVLTCTVKVTD